LARRPARTLRQGFWLRQQSGRSILGRSPDLQPVLTPELLRLRLVLAQPREPLQVGNPSLIWRPELDLSQPVLSRRRSARRRLRPQRHRLPRRRLRARRAPLPLEEQRQQARGAARGRLRGRVSRHRWRHQVSRPAISRRRRVSQDRTPALCPAARLRSLQVRLRLRLPLEGHLSRAATSPACPWPA
jgi:hypothetical protein